MAKKATTKKKAAPKGAKAASKADDFRSHSADELSSQLSNLKKEQFNLRFQRANCQVENTGRIRMPTRSWSGSTLTISVENRGPSSHSTPTQRSEFIISWAAPGT